MNKALLNFLGVFAALVVLSATGCSTTSSRTTSAPDTDSRGELTAPDDYPQTAVPDFPAGVPEVTPRIIVHKNRIYFGGDELLRLEDGAVPAEFKQGGEDSLLIEPLVAPLAATLQQDPEPKLLLITIQADATYRLITELMYTAGEAGYETFEVQVIGEDSSGQR